MRRKEIIDLYVYDRIILRIYTSPDDKTVYEDWKVHVIQDGINITIRKDKK